MIMAVEPSKCGRSYNKLHTIKHKRVRKRDRPKPGFYQEYFRLPDAAKLVGISYATLLAWVHRGMVPAYFLGRKFLRVRLYYLLTPYKEQPSLRAEFMAQLDREAWPTAVYSIEGLTPEPVPIKVPVGPAPVSSIADDEGGVGCA